jgi:hypothetical protein
VIQRKAGLPVQLEITEQTCSAIGEWPAVVGVRRPDICFRAASGSSGASRRSSTPGSFIDGWSAPASIARPMERSQSAARPGSDLQEDRQPASGAAIARAHEI